MNNNLQEASSKDHYGKGGSMEKQKDYSAIWRTVALLAVGIIIGLLMSKSVLAFDEAKWNLCGANNMSGGNCDDFYEAWLISKGFAQNRTGESFYNASDVDQKLQAIGYNRSEFYNRTEIDEKLNATQPVNVSVDGNYLTIQDFLDFRDNLSRSYVERREFEVASFTSANTSSQSFDLNPTMIVVLIAVFAIGGMFVWSTKRKQQAPKYSYDPLLAKRAEQMEKIKEMNRAENAQ